jgi:hypothetical protein
MKDIQGTRLFLRKTIKAKILISKSKAVPVTGREGP